MKEQFENKERLLVFPTILDFPEPDCPDFDPSIASTPRFFEDMFDVPFAEGCCVRRGSKGCHRIPGEEFNENEDTYFSSSLQTWSFEVMSSTKGQRARSCQAVVNA